MQVRADAYDKLDKELLGFVEDVLLNQCENATERMLEFAATLDPKSKPTAVRKKVDDRPQGPQLPPKLNPRSGKAHIAAPDPIPAVPEYKAWSDPVKKSAEFAKVRLWLSHGTLDLKQ